ncbi:MAG: hypothetical protein ACKN9W_00425, partial [Methylococcus sp.]
MFKKSILALSLAGLAGLPVAYADQHESLDTSTAGMESTAAAPADTETSYAAPVSSGEFTDDRWYAAPFGTYLQPAGSRNAQGGWGAGLALGKIINEYFNVEVKGFWQEYKGRPDGALTAWGHEDITRYNADLTGGS